MKDSTDMTAKEAVKHINNTPAKKLNGFISDSEERKTVLQAVKAKKTDQSKDKPKPLSQIMDTFIKQGGNWDTILAKIDEVVKERGMKPYTKGRVKAHIKRRLAKDADYLGKRELTDEGIK